MQSKPERWLPVPGYEDYYEVSDHMRVRSLPREVKRPNGVIQHRRARLLKLTLNEGKHPFVELRVQGKRRRFSVRKLAAQAFGPELTQRECPTCGTKFSHRLAYRDEPLYCSDECKPRCSVDGCKRPRRKREWCVNHYTVWLTKGDPTIEPDYKWATDWVCVVCGKDVPKNSGRRKHCSSRCQVIDSRFKGNTPRAVKCAKCGDFVDLIDHGERARKRRSDTKLCDDCRPDHPRQWRKNLDAIMARDNNRCGICGGHIDIQLKYPHPLSATVDHILPRALGGTHEVENLQPSHAVCNSTKQARPDYVPETKYGVAT